MRSGDPHLSVQTHLSFGRMEARAGHFETAQRHFGVARELLTLDGNVWLSAAVDLDESGLLGLTGDVVGALELAESGGRRAEESGWAKGKVVAAVNKGRSFTAYWAASTELRTNSNCLLSSVGRARATALRWPKPEPALLSLLKTLDSPKRFWTNLVLIRRSCNAGRASRPGS